MQCAPPNLAKHRQVVKAQFQYMPKETIQQFPAYLADESRRASNRADLRYIFLLQK